ncbi:MAG: hypothetical protein K5931_04100, partial [Lachnospiraceae bacterium]|nr:hypothetical protein [Lachnospiraceae bacterium]
RYPCVVVTGKGSYKDAGSKKLAFTIEKKSLTASDVKVEPLYTKIYYSGKENKPGVDVIWDGGYLKKGRDYDISYENNVEISTGSEAKPTVTITGKGNYEGSRTVEFAIEKRPYSLWVDGCEDNKLYSRNIYYTGRKNEPRNLDVYWFDQKLTEGKDYTVKYDNNIDVYTDLSQSDAEKNAPAIIITGKGTYAACKLRVLFKIKPTDLGDTYTCNTILAYKKGKIQKGKTKVNLVSDYSDVITLKEGRDYRIEYDKAYAVDENGEKIEDFKGTILSDIGTYKIPIQGIGNFSLDDGGCFFKEIIKEKKETINFDNISKAVFKYDGQVNPKIVKSWEGDKYYLSLKKCKLYYNINGVETELKEYKEGEKLGDCHYVANYKNNDGAGKATVTFIGINDFTGKLTRTFTIDKASFNKRDDIGGVYEIKGLEKSYTYLKNGVTPEIKVKYLLDDTTTVMEEGKDYTVKYVNNKECCDIKTLSENSASAPTVIVTGKGDYSGTLKATYAITKSSIFNLGGYSYATDIKYTGRPFKNMSKPAIYIYDDNGERLKAGTDYEKNVSYFYEEATEVTKKGSEAKISRAAGDKIEDTDIIPAGAKLYAVVTGKNNYTGTDAKAVSTVKISFSCYDSKNDISKSTVSLNDKGKDKLNRNIGRSFTLDEDEIDVKYNKAILDKDGSTYSIPCVIENSNSGKMTVIVQGCGEYGGVKKLTVNLRAGKQK